MLIPPYHCIRIKSEKIIPAEKLITRCLLRAHAQLTAMLPSACRNLHKLTLCNDLHTATYD
jgi:hypothetical protein